MTLYSNINCPYSQRTRMVLAEKNISAEIVFVEDDSLPEDVIDLNPYNTTPTLVDRDLVLYNSRIIMEYLDERYPHPPLLPVDPVARAQTRVFLYRIERDWYSLLPDLVGLDHTKAEQARKVLLDGLTAVAPIFEQKPFFMSDELSVVDCTLAPLLWRLPAYQVQLPPQAAPLLKYAENIFARDSFAQSLTEAEKAVRA